MLASPGAALEHRPERRVAAALGLAVERWRESLGLKPRLAQEPTWKRLEGLATAPCDEVTLALDRHRPAIGRVEGEARCGRRRRGSCGR